MTNDTESSDWRDSIKILKAYSEFRKSFHKMPEPFQNMWDGYLRNTNTATQRFEMTLAYIQPIHSAPHRREPKARQLRNDETERNLEVKLFGTAQIELALLVLFSFKKDRSKRFCADYQRLKSVTIKTF